MDILGVIVLALLGIGKVIILCLIPLGALAESSATSESTSSSGVYFGGNSPSAPSVGGSSNNTGPCILGNSLGFSIPGVGINIGAGRVDKECNVREEAKAINALIGKKAAIAHLCKHDKTIRETLVEKGYCKVK